MGASGAAGRTSPGVDAVTQDDGAHPAADATPMPTTGSGVTVTVGGETQEVPADAQVAWIDAGHGVATISHAGRSVRAVVEGEGTEWVITLFGRRIPVTVQNRRERLLAAEVTSRASTGPATVKATLPGLVAKVSVTDGSDVEEGASLVTIEAMKMQNEVRAPRSGRVAGLAVTSGQTVRPGDLLLRIE